MKKLLYLFSILISLPSFGQQIPYTRITGLSTGVRAATLSNYSSNSSAFSNGESIQTFANKAKYQIELNTTNIALKASLLGNYTSNTSAFTNGDNLQTFANKAKYKLENTADVSTATIAGDVTGTLAASSVARIQGTSVQASTPTNGQILQYNSSASRYEPTTLSSVDATAVHLGGSEVITGLKTFSAKPTSTAGIDVTGNNALAQSNSGKSTITWGRLQNYSPNANQDQVVISNNLYFNSGTAARDNTALGASRMILNAGNANNLQSAALVLTTPSGVDVTGVRTLMSSTATITNNQNGLTFLGDVSSTPHSTLHNGGSNAQFSRSITALRTLDATDNVVFANGTFSVTLPTAVGITDRQYTIKNTGSGTITIATTSSQTIDGATTYVMSVQYKYVQVQSNGSNWYIIANN